MNITRRLRYLVIAAVMLAFSVVSSAQVLLSVNFGPPALPVYPQPVCPTEGYIWTPGYWAWGPYGYYWVPGTWVPVPQPGLLWTPGYWAYDGGLYYWHPGYWGPVVGFYGGIPYGYGYTGNGYYGGYWRQNQFFYNQTVNNVTVTNVHNVYNTTVINNTTNVTQVSYNGGPGGIVAHPTPEQEAIAREQHVAPTPLQIQHENTAKNNPQLRASVNQGRPSIAATAKPGDFSAHSAVAATRAGAPYRAAENRSPSESSVPRTGQSERPEAEGGNAAPRNNVPRPPSASEGTPRPEARPSDRASGEPSAPRNVPRPPSSYQPGSSSRGSATTNGETSHPEKASQGANVPHPESVPRPQSSEGTAPRPDNASRPSSGSRPQNSPPAQAAPKHQSAPQQQAAPHPPAAPRSESAPSRPEETRPHENPPQR